MGHELGASLVVILTLIGLLIAVLWVLMPFAIFGTKDRLKAIELEQRETNRLLTKLVDVIERQAAAARNNPPT